MKRLLLLLTILGIFTATAQAQRGFHVGLNAGLNNTSIIDKNKYGDVDYDYKMTLNHTVGLAFGYNFTDHFGLVAEFNDAHLGQKYDIPLAKGGYWEKEINLMYTQIPLLLQYSGGPWKSRFTAGIGPQWSYLRRATMTEGPEMGEGDVTNSFNDRDFGLLMTAGGDIFLYENFYMNLGLRFYYGFNDINSSERVVMTSQPDTERLNNAYAGVSVGVHYLFSKER